MIDFKDLNHSRVFELFEELSRIPHGSGNRGAIAQFCADFAEKNSLRYIVDDAKNVIIYKDASHGFENAAPVILQGHLDMVCQKTPENPIDFEKEGITLVREGDTLHADGTTLGADNGIAVAMVLSILERNDLPHPPIEALFTADEEIGMLGAVDLDTSLLHAKRLINLDSEDDDTVTVSCAGGSEFKAYLPLHRQNISSAGVKIELCGLKGGHSGVEIASHRVNAATLAGRLLTHLSKETDFELISVNSGTKANAIPNTAVIELASAEPQKLATLAQQYVAEIQAEIAGYEEGFRAEISTLETKECLAIDKKEADSLIYALTCTPNGIIEMSAEIKGLVETSLNLGILTTDETEITLCYALRSNKTSTLAALEEKLDCFFSRLPVTIKTSGHYPPWEFKKDSELTALYVETYREKFGKVPKVEAIHAGLECAVFSSAIEDVDCIAIGPTIRDAHTVNEHLSIASTESVYELVLRMLEKLAK
ncbi:MAG: aminoacyl-histidine dipeptidase [Ruminococcaceae bacterium]|nr:aminoacyl-histidine dipeptidase [Oscillospiraceae bacterium]